MKTYTGIVRWFAAGTLTALMMSAFTPAQADGLDRDIRHNRTDIRRDQRDIRHDHRQVGSLNHRLDNEIDHHRFGAAVRTENHLDRLHRDIRTDKRDARHDRRDIRVDRWQRWDNNH